MSLSKELSSHYNSEDEHSLAGSIYPEEIENGYKEAISSIPSSLLQSWLFYQLKKSEDIQEFEQLAVKAIGRWCNFLLAMKYVAAIFSCGIILLVDYIRQYYQHDKKTIWYGASPFLTITSLQAELSSRIISVKKSRDEKINDQEILSQYLYFTQEQIYQKISELLSPVKDSRSFSTVLWEKFAVDLLSPLKNLYVHATDLQNKQKTGAENKSNEILLFLQELWNVKGNSEFEKIQEMRNLVEEILNPMALERHSLLVNQGHNLYKATSGILTFFKGRCYKIDFQSERYYVNSSTEHYLVQLYYVLSLYTFVFSPKISRTGEVLGGSPEDVNYLYEAYEKETEHLKI